MPSPFYTKSWFLLALGAFVVAAALLLLFYINTPRTSDVLPAVTATRVPPTFATAPADTPLLVEATETPRPLFAFGTLGEVETIQITDDENSMFQRQQHFTLHKQGTSFMGSGEFYARYYPYPQTPVTFTRKVSVPQEAVQSFLAMLQPLADAEPVRPTDTIYSIPDCYPTVILLLHTNNGDATFSSKYCQDDNKMLWDVEYKGIHSTTFTNIPKYALNLLVPYLRYDVLESAFESETPKP